MNTVDELMDIDPLKLTKEDIAKVVGYHRQRRADRLEGKAGKPKKEVGKVSLDGVLKNLVGEKPKAGAVTRRI